MSQLIGWLLLAACVVFHGVALRQIVNRIRHRHRVGRLTARGSAGMAAVRVR